MLQYFFLVDCCIGRMSGNRHNIVLTLSADVTNLNDASFFEFIFIVFSIKDIVIYKQIKQMYMKKLEKRKVLDNKKEV